jgi:uncharacterized membrane protein
VESGIILVLVAILAAVAAAPVLAILALVRVRALERKLDRFVPATESRPPAFAREVERARPPAAPPQPPPPAPPRAAQPPPPDPPWPELRPPELPRPAVSATPPALPPRPSLPPIDWERWIGIRGAAVLGAIALALAGLLFFKYSIERGLITPTMRVVFGTLSGLGCVVGSEALRTRRYRTTADAVAGSGIVILYGAFWAAHVLYGLVGFGVAFALMVLVTVACALLALRRDALMIAVIGLVGGFATPILLATGSDRPLGLFGYVLLLDLGLLALGRRRSWPSLALLSLVGTVVLEGLWIGARMGPDRALLGLAILAVFAVLVVAVGRRAPDASEGPWLWAQAGAVLFPFAFAFYFALRVDLGPRLWPIALLLALLAGAAGWVARERGLHSLRTGAAAGSVAVVGVWTIAHTLTAPLAWELAAVAVALAAVFHVWVERDPEDTGLESPDAAALVANLGFFLLLLVAARVAGRLPPWPWIAGWTALAAFAYRQAAFPERAGLQLAAAVGLGFGMSVLGMRELAASTLPPASVWLAVLVAAAVAALAIAPLRAEAAVRRRADQAAAALALLLLAGLAVAPRIHATGPLLALGVALLLGVMVAVGGTRLGSGAWIAAAVAATLGVHAAWTWAPAGAARPPGVAALALGMIALAVVVFTAWPFLAARRLASEPLAWYAAALAGPLAFLPLKRLYEVAFGSATIGLLPIALGALALAAVARARRAWPAGDPMRLTALVWFSAVALGLVSVAIPLQLAKEWITIGWALEGVAVIALWRRLDHPGLKYLGVALLCAAGLRLAANPAVLGYYPRSTRRLVNWLGYSYLVPSAAMVAGALLLRPLEVARLRPWERQVYGERERPLGVIATFGAAVVVVFVWINLAIADWYATGPRLELSFGDTPAQRLTVSIAWAVYAVALLGLGMRRDSLGLRWVSLGFLLVTIAKVFLYDLGALGDLYRVASLVGLAVSLILVSFLYQRFVFRRSGETAP